MVMADLVYWLVSLGCFSAYFGGVAIGASVGLVLVVLLF